MRVGIIGSGQLARMLALAGLRLGYDFSFLVDKDSSNDTRCIQGLGDIVVYDDSLSTQAVYQRLGAPQVITIEKEQVDIKLLQALGDYCPVLPNPNACATCSDRHLEKQLLHDLQIPHARYRFLENAAQASQSLSGLNLPLFAKSTHFAYDGRNQFVLQSSEDVATFASAGHIGNWIVEEAIPFDREVSVIAVRSTKGEVALYPFTENIHHRGILVYSISPCATLTEDVRATLTEYAHKIANALDYVGVFAIECFIQGEQVFVNELAPRVHNSGHWTSTGSVTCQFENHLRAIGGLQLGSTATTGFTGMVNLIGTDKPPLHLLTGNSSLHWYNKSPRPGRKVGHVNFSNASLTELKTEMAEFATRLGGLPLDNLQSVKN